MSKGFHNCYHNHNHDSWQYSNAENQFRQLLCEMGEFKEGLDFLHEHMIRAVFGEHSNTKKNKSLKTYIVNRF